MNTQRDPINGESFQPALLQEWTGTVSIRGGLAGRGFRNERQGVRPGKNKTHFSTFRNLRRNLVR